MSPLSLPLSEGDRPHGAVAPPPLPVASFPSFQRFDPPPLHGSAPPVPLTLPSLPPDGSDDERGVLAFLRRLREAIAASAWATLATRVTLLAAGILVLAVVGRLTTTRPARAESAFDARGAAPSTSAALASPSSSAAMARADSPGLVPTPTAPPALSESASPPSRTRATAEDPVFLNYASAEELRRLPGAGHKRANAIVALRERIGRFQRVEDLLRVKGIGRATIRKWRPLIRLDAPSPRPAIDGGSG